MSILQPEASVWYGVCLIVIGARFYSKKLRLGSWKALQVDDYLVAVAITTLTILVALLHITRITQTTLIIPNAPSNTDSIVQVNYFEVPLHEYGDRIYGSKLSLVAEQMYILTIWVLKVSLLILFGRMTGRGLSAMHILVKLIAFWVGISFVALELLWLLAWCHPLSDYWAVPPDNLKCSTMRGHLITTMILNITTDLLIMAIPLRLLSYVQSRRQQYIIVGLVFMLGGFTIIAAIINKVESLTHPYTSDWMIWYLREAFTTMLCANVLLLPPTIQHVFGTKWKGWVIRKNASGRKDALTQARQGASLYHPPPEPSASPLSSEQHCNPRVVPLEIMQSTEIRIESSIADPSKRTSRTESGNNYMGNNNTVSDSSSIESSQTPTIVVTACFHEDGQREEQEERVVPAWSYHYMSRA